MTRGRIVRLLALVSAAAMLSLAAAQTIRIGATAAATGAASALGEPEANTFRMLQDQLNAAGGINGVPVEIIFLDTASDTAQAVTNVNRSEERRVGKARRARYCTQRSKKKKCTSPRK